MKTEKINTRFMQGNKDIDCEIFDIMIDNYGHEKVLLENDINFEDAIYSNGFIHAIENGLIPTLELISSIESKRPQEYHHIIINDECYIMYFISN